MCPTKLSIPHKFGGEIACQAMEVKACRERPMKCIWRVFLRRVGFDLSIGCSGVDRWINRAGSLPFFRSGIHPLSF
jgi:hypothetical protein